MAEATRTTHDTLEAAITAAQLDADVISQRGFVVVKKGTKGFQVYATKTPAAPVGDIEELDGKKADIVARQDHHTGAWVDAEVVDEVVRPPEVEQATVAETNEIRPEDEPYAGGPEYKPV